MCLPNEIKKRSSNIDLYGKSVNKIIKKSVPCFGVCISDIYIAKLMALVFLPSVGPPIGTL